MKYYKVKKECDNKRFNGGFYIGNELYTESEVIKKQLNKEFMEIVNINKNKTCFVFGARFEIN